MRNYVKTYSGECSKNGLSVVAFDLETGRIVGAFLNKDFSVEATLIEGDTNLFSKFLVYLNENLWNQIKHPMKEVTAKENHVVDMMLIAVNGNYMGRKIGSRLCEFSFKVAKERGFRHAFSWIVNERIRHLFDKEGAETVSKIEPGEYESYEYQGDRLLVKMPKTTPLEHMVKTFT